MQALLDLWGRFAGALLKSRPWEFDNRAALWLLACIPIVWILGTWIRGLGWTRRVLAIFFRSLAVLCLVLGLARLGASSEIVLPGGLVYLVDASSSIASSQKRWAM